MYSGGTVWQFIYEKGSFEVEFRADSYNHFICKDFPAHSHWTMSNNSNQIALDFGKYGEFELVLEVYNNGSAIMNGYKKGNPNNWRKCELKSILGKEGVILSDAGHDHSHSHGEHVHTATCGHKQ